MIATTTTIAIVYTIIEFHSLIPVIVARTVVEAVIACSLSRILYIVSLFIFTITISANSRQIKLIIGIIEVILR